MTYSMILDMENYMEGEMQDGMEYSRLAEIAPNKRARRLLEQPSAADISHVQQLQDAYYVLTRQEYIPVSILSAKKETYAQGLKKRLLDESLDFRVYGAKYLETQDAALKNLFYRLSADVAVHTSQLTLLLFELLEKE